jgi:hypothetical protein
MDVPGGLADGYMAAEVSGAPGGKPSEVSGAGPDRKVSEAPKASGAGLDGKPSEAAKAGVPLTLSKITSLRTAIIRSPAGGHKPKNFGGGISAYAERDDSD